MWITYLVLVGFIYGWGFAVVNYHRMLLGQPHYFSTLGKEAGDRQMKRIHLLSWAALFGVGGKTLEERRLASVPPGFLEAAWNMALYSALGLAVGVIVHIGLQILLEKKN